MSIATDTLIADARNHVTDVLANAQVNMNYGIATLRALQPAAHNTFTFANQVQIPEDPGAVPAAPDSTFSDPGLNVDAPTMIDVGDLELPPDVGPAPTPLAYTAPIVPTGEPSTEIIGPAPDVADFPEIPDMPDLLGEIRSIQRPPLLSLVMPPDPEFREPEFNGVRPTDPTPPPTDLDTKLRAAYTEMAPVMRDAIESHFDAVLDREFPAFRPNLATTESLLARYMAGGTALSSAVEDQIYSRTQDKTNSEFRKAEAQAMGVAARAGQTLIGPSLVGIRRDIDMDRRNANNRASIEMAIKQAELEQQNLQFAITQSNALRSIAINFISQYIGQLVQLNGQALDYARSLIDAIVKAYDIAARFSEIQARIYEADARVYEARLQAARVLADFYSAKIRGLEAQANVNTAQVNAYKALLEGVTAEATVYRAAIDALTGFASVERLKVDIYQARTSAFVAQQNAFTSKWIGFKAMADGEVAKQQVSAQLLKTYEAQVNANNSIIDGKTKALTARSQQNEQSTRVYESGIRAYSALVAGKAAVSEAIVHSFDNTIKAFLAKAGAVAEKSRAQIAAFQAAQDATTHQANIQLADARERNALEIAKTTGIARVTTAAGEVYGHVAGAMGSGMNTLVAQTVTGSI